MSPCSKFIFFSRVSAGKPTVCSNLGNYLATRGPSEWNCASSQQSLWERNPEREPPTGRGAGRQARPPGSS